MVMAGHAFQKCQQRTFSVRSYASAACVFEKRNWFHIDDHLNYNMGRYGNFVKQ